MCPSFRIPILLLVITIITAVILSPVFAGVEVLDAGYRPDTALPQFNYLWNSGYKPGDTPPNYILSGALVAYVKNTGTSSVTLSDVTLQGVSLTQAFGCITSKTYRDGLAYACSIHIPGTNPITSTQRQTLIDAGEPVWWRIDPDVIAPGETAELFIRMRVRKPLTLSLSIQTSAGSVPLSIVVSDTIVPRVAGYSLSPSRDKLYLYFRHTQKGKSPTQVRIDGQDVTNRCVIGSDAGMDIIPVVYSPASPLTRGKFYCFQALYDDGTKASAGTRTFTDEFWYGLWGGANAATLAEGRAHVEDMGRHCVNLQVQGAPGMTNDFMKSAEGLALMDQLGMWRTNADPDKTFGRLAQLFLCDEPDAGDAAVPLTAVPTYAQNGTLAQSLVTRGDSFRSAYSAYPNLLNLDSTFKPHNWYTYGQVPDVFSADPYYQTRLTDSYWTRPYQIPLYSKATYIYAVSSVCQAACEPKPLHIILSCTRRQDGSRVFRWATPEEKRIEAYYALAGGAKQLAYWWFTPLAINASGSSGCGAYEPEARSLWREMGLIGAEVRTAGPVIVRSCPAQVPVDATGGLWVKSLIRGTDTLVLLVVNDDYANDNAGTVIRPVENASMSVTLPSWLNASQVFEVNYKGTRDAVYTRTGNSLEVNLGTVDVTRLLIVTSDTTLRSSLQNFYDTKFAQQVSQIIPNR